MNIFKGPRWISQFNYPYQSFEDVPSDIFQNINKGLDQIQSKDPIVSILISAWDEEVNILKCIGSLSKLKSKFPLEIIVINNNSEDKTQNTLDKLNIKSYFQVIQGWGPARQMAQEKAVGKYILLADADCIYPDCWVDVMMKVLLKPRVVAVYGRYSFIPELGFPRWKLSILESLKDVIAEVRHIKRPYLNAYGISMGYIKELGLKVGFVMHKVRGEDGRLCFDLMQYGEIRQVRSNKARVWTGPRTLERDGSFGKALTNRIKKEGMRFFSMFSAEKPHDTKSSSND